jgi:hypothetical protein
MKEIKKFMVCLLGMAAMVMCVMVSSCTNEEHNTEMRSAPKAQPEPTPDPSRSAIYDFVINCTPTESSFTHQGTSTIDIYVDGAESPEKTFTASLKSTCSIIAEKDTVRISANEAAPEQTSCSIARSFKGNREIDNIVITMSDGQTLSLPYEAEHSSAKWMDALYQHGKDSLISARALKPERVEEKGATRAAGVSETYIKEKYTTKYPVEVKTQAYAGGRMVSEDLDTLYAQSVTLVLDKNGSTDEKTQTGEEVINEEQQKDSVIITRTWDDGHSERLSFNAILNRHLKNIERREVIVPSFDGQSAGSSFSRIEGGETMVRSDANWTIYGREVVITKMVSVGGHSEEIRYTFYQERADFSYETINHSFGYVDWQVTNYADDFKAAAVSTKSGYDELNYKNEIKTNYLGYIQMSDEVVAWYKEQVKVIGFDAINAQRVDYPTYTFVSLDKIAYYSDGTNKKVGTFSAKLPISVNPLTNWLINEDVWGVYVSGAFEGSQTGREAKTAEKFFSYNRYSYRYANTVAGQTNALSVSVPNDIVFNDGDVEYKFGNSELTVDNKGDNTSRVSEDESKTTYAYTCTAGVTFGESSQDCTLPGTINLVKMPEPEPIHDHGKVVATYCTSTPDESRSHWYNVACIQFEDGYRMVGMTSNESMEFDFSMSSWNGVNSAVYTNGMWVPAFAEDNAGANCMVWTGENGGRRVLDYITATAQGWNNGHNTVWDIRREGRISEDGYSVTFYLNGLAGQTLNF